MLCFCVHAYLFCFLIHMHAYNSACILLIPAPAFQCSSMLNPLGWMSICHNHVPWKTMQTCSTLTYSVVLRSETDNTVRFAGEAVGSLSVMLSLRMHFFAQVISNVWAHFTSMDFQHCPTISVQGPSLSLSPSLSLTRPPHLYINM